MKSNQTEDNKILTANTFILHQSKRYERLIMGLELLKIIGADNIFNKNKFKLDFNIISKYIEKKEYIIRLLFRCKKIDINTISPDEKEKNEILKYINSKLRSIFNIHIKKVDKKSNEYIIDNMDFWCDKINPYNENEDLKIELLISNMLESMDINEYV